LKDVIIRKGENISARAIEEELVAHPAVADVAVVGLPHPKWGEIACAGVTLCEPGATLTLTDVSSFLDRRSFSKRQRPERLEVVSTLPRNATGKVLKDELRRTIGTTTATTA
jgi:acyl-CoA synthetase (AMP-forming)/AMP-acid ligase II